MRTWRRKSVYDPSFRMDRTHMFPVGTTNIPTGDVFPERTHQVTFSCHIKITSATPAGVAFELGSATTGIAIWIAAADRKIMAAVGDAIAADGVTLAGPVCVNGKTIRVVLSCIPANGKARLWADGRLVASGQATGLTLPNGWSDTGEGAVGGIDTAVTARVAVGDRISLTGASLVSPVNVFQGQRPRNFYEVS